jgi:hypothetical protein
LLSLDLHNLLFNQREVNENHMYLHLACFLGMDKSFFKKNLKSYLNTSQSSIEACSVSNFIRGMR